MLYFIVVVASIALVISIIKRLKEQKSNNRWPEIHNPPTISENNNRKDKLFTEKCPLIKRKLMTRNELPIYI